MTTLLTPNDIARIVAAHGLPAVLRRMEEAITADFRRWPDFDKVARVAAHSKTGVIELMPVADAHQYSFKYVNGHPGNARHGLPTVMAFGVLADVATGAPLLLSELTITTAIRTAATSVMAARALMRQETRPGSRTMALIGNGAQSEFQALAFHHGLGIDTLRLFDTDPAATDKLVRHLRGVPGLKLQVCTSTAEAVRGADIVTTVTADKRNAVIVDASMLEPGMHLNAVGGDCPGKTELAAGVLRAANVFVEYEPGRRSEAEVTVFDSVGFALEDFSALRLMGSLAAALGLGEPLALIPQLADTKDLFAQLTAVQPALRAA
jgi:ornithine cyclodeaminase